MMLYDVLKASKGLYVDDEYAMLWGKQLGGWTASTLTGTLPMTFRSNGTALIDYRIYGTAEGAGVQTENLFDYSQGCDWASGLNGASNQKITAQQGDSFTITSTSALYALVRGYGANDVIIGGSAWSTGGTSTYTAPANISYVKVIFRNFEYTAITAEQKVTINEAMLVKGSTTPETYEPYGYKLPLVVASGTESKTADIYIGDTKLGSDDYIDYESGKIVRNGTPQDPPLPFPELETFNGTNTLDSTETLEEVTITGMIKEAE